MKIFWMMLVGILSLSTAGQAQQLTDKEKALFVDPKYMGGYGFVFDHPEKYETFTKTPFTEKSVEYNYAFRCENCSQSLLIQQSISIESSEKDADSSYQIEEQTTKAMMGKWLAYKGYASFYPCGKRWEYKMLTSTTNEKPVGFIYHYQKGRYTGTLMIIGFVFEDQDQFKEFMEPLVKRADDAMKVLGL